jgi:penicillin-binding protein 1C
VVGVWMGRADGTPVPGAFGGELAAPVMFAAFQRTAAQVTPLPPPPPNTLIVAGAALPQPLQRFGGPEPAQTGPDIAFPPDGAILIGPGLTARVSDGLPPFIWLANGAPVGASRSREFAFPNLGPGFSTITVIDATGTTARTRISLQ